MSQHRHLAAIMFTDIVGYTAIMGKDEAKAMGLVHRSRTIQKRLVDEFEGEWLKEMGDGVMCSFPSASDAVYCALDIQEQLFKHEDLQLRIGIHLGEVLVENGDIYSDGVNIAARLQQIAEPGGIYLSESVQKAIRGQTDIHTVYLGELQLKNVDYAVKTYALRGEGLPSVTNGAAKRLSGRVWAGIKQRNVHRAGAAYLGFSLLVISLIPLVPLFKLFHLEILGLLILGFIVALLLAWNYERGPRGFIRTNTRESWENPFSYHKKKPFTSNLAFLLLFMVMIIINAFTLIDNKNPQSNFNELSIAVLPFSNFSSDSSKQHFADGIQDDILTRLSKNPVFDVKSRTSTLRYRDNTRLNMTEIGKELGVAHVLEGSIRMKGNHIRVTAQLIEVTNDRHIWSESYNREVYDCLATQQELARVISQALENKLTQIIFDG